VVNRLRLSGIVLVVAVSARAASAHEVRPAYLELKQTGAETYDVLFKVPGSGENLRLALYPDLPAACATQTAPKSTFVDNAFTDRWSVRCEGGLAGRTIGIKGLAASATDVLVRLARREGRSQIVRLTPDKPSFVVEAEPSAWRVALTYLRLGRDHILLGVDHLLFVLGLLLIVPDRWMLLKTITAFTLAHSLTLAVATLGYASAPVPPLNAAIALSILFLGPEIVRHERGGTSLTLRHPWVVAFAFGLLHGFGFASGLNTVGLPRGDIPLALLFFNLGVEAGQLGFVALMLLLLRSFRALEMRWPRIVELAPGYTVGALGAYWTIQRTWMLFGGRR
jgi:hydrogenase/urease accessory protein HupE